MGCEKPLIEIGGKPFISPECEGCYTDALATRWGFKVWGRTAPRRFFGEKHWREPLQWDREAKAAGERHRVFAISMGDLLEDRRDLDPHRARLWDLISGTENLAWLLLTKRAESLETLVPECVWQLPNVWPGVTAACQATADLRIPFLLRLKKRFPHLIAWLSVEPMLEPLVLSRWLREDGTGLNWVVIGGESGPKARPFNVDAARTLMKQCQDNRVPVFWKQFGARPVSEATVFGDPKPNRFKFSDPPAPIPPSGRSGQESRNSRGAK